MPIQLANNASGTIATAISASDTGVALTTGDGAAFPVLGLGDYFYATITSSGGTQEIVKATARSGDSLTIVRAQESTVAQSFAAGSRFELRVTAQSIIDTAQQFVTDADLSLRIDLAAPTGSSLIGFQQTGSGTVLRTAQTKLRETVSVLDFGADPTGIVDATDEIKAAIAYGKLSGLRVTGAGNFRTSDKIVINCPFDGSDMTFLVYGTPAVAVELSTGNGTNPTDIFSLTTELGIVLPSVRNMTKPGTGWAGQGIGVRYVNVQNMKITERLVRDFAIGVQATCYVQGCGYNTVQGGFLYNNGVNRQITVGDSLGFTNRWDVYGGRYFHFSAEGTAVTGVFHIDVVPNATGNIINDWNFFGASLEGDAQQYQVRNGGTFINFWGCRWETPGGARIHLAFGGLSGQGTIAIFNGRGASAPGAAGGFVVTKDAGASGRTNIQSSSGSNMIVTPNPTVLTNTQSALDPVLVGYEPTTDQFTANPLTAYSSFFGSQKIGGKRSADTNDRVYMDLVNGRMYFGSGSATPTLFLDRTSTGLRLQGGAFLIPDGITAPGNITGFATLYVDSADGSLKVKFGDGTTKTIATNP
jgi:hypothetical protein